MLFNFGCCLACVLRLNAWICRFAVSLVRVVVSLLVLALVWLLVLIAVVLSYDVLLIVL